MDTIAALRELLTDHGGSVAVSRLRSTRSGFDVWTRVHLELAFASGQRAVVVGHSVSDALRRTVPVLGRQGILVDADPPRASRWGWSDPDADLTPRSAARQRNRYSA